MCVLYSIDGIICHELSPNRNFMVGTKIQGNPIYVREIPR